MRSVRVCKLILEKTMKFKLVTPGLLCIPGRSRLMPCRQSYVCASANNPSVHTPNPPRPDNSWRTLQQMNSAQLCYFLRGRRGPRHRVVSVRSDFIEKRRTRNRYDTRLSPRSAVPVRQPAYTPPSSTSISSNVWYVNLSPSFMPGRHLERWLGFIVISALPDCPCPIGHRFFCRCDFLIPWVLHSAFGLST